MTYRRYILVRKDTRSVDYTAPTIGELFNALHAARSCERVGRSGTWSYYVNAHEVVDLFEEPGRIVYALQSPPRLPRWEPGTYFHDDDNSALRFQAMELV